MCLFYSREQLYFYTDASLACCIGSWKYYRLQKTEIWFMLQETHLLRGFVWWEVTKCFSRAIAYFGNWILHSTSGKSKIFSPPHVQTSYGAHWASSSIAVEVKQLWCEGDHSPESSVEVKTKWSYTCLSLGCLRGTWRDSHTLVCYLWVSHNRSLYLHGRDLNKYTFVCVYFFFFLRNAAICMMVSEWS
jgi:hypothetical protein